MDRNAEQAAPSTSTGLHIGAQQPPAHASTSTEVKQDELWDWDFLNEQPGMGRAGSPGAGPSDPYPYQPNQEEGMEGKSLVSFRFLFVIGGIMTHSAR